MHDMAKFVKERLHLIVRQQRRLICRWFGKITDHHANRRLFGPLRRSSNSKYGGVSVFAIPRMQISVEVANRFVCCVIDYFKL
jgi:hypothetical protein